MIDSCHQVVLHKCSEYDENHLLELIDGITAHLNVFRSLHGKKVLLKPNLISSFGPSHCCTHPQFIKAVAKWCLAGGATVKIGDSPAFGSTRSVCRKHGILDALKGLDVEFIEFTTPEKKTLEGGISVTLAREPLECDLFVGLPKIKAHSQLFVTMAVKNIFGIVKGAHKGMLHMVNGKSHDHFANLILDLIPLLPPQLHLCDGVEVMHRSGPLDGTPLQLGCVGGATSPVALDCSLLELLELDFAKSPLQKMARKRNLEGSDYSSLQFPALSPEDFHPSGFQAPGQLNPIRFNPFRFVKNFLKKTVAVQE